LTTVSSADNSGGRSTGGKTSLTVNRLSAQAGLSRDHRSMEDKGNPVRHNWGPSAAASDLPHMICQRIFAITNDDRPRPSSGGLAALLWLPTMQKTSGPVVLMEPAGRSIDSQKQFRPYYTRLRSVMRPTGGIDLSGWRQDDCSTRPNQTGVLQLTLTGSTHNQQPQTKTSQFGPVKWVAVAKMRPAVTTGKKITTATMQNWKTIQVAGLTVSRPVASPARWWGC